MSCTLKLQEPFFVSRSGDTRRAYPLQRHECDKLVEAMKSKVLPLFEETGGLLMSTGFSIAKTEFFGQMASLMVASGTTPVTGFLRFQIHETFALLVNHEPIFWMITIFNGCDMVTAKPGRLSGVEDPELLLAITQDFAAACLQIQERHRAAEKSVHDPVSYLCASDHSSRVVQLSF
jgi:hypothetical protein